MSFQNRYGFFDRLLHRVAFATRTAQLGLADLERRSYRAELDAVEASRPVFVTSLPRAGTTIMLEVLAAMPQFATHTYRDMPFVLCPMVWHRLSKPFRRADEPHERAHGDRIQISLDSPEAFEEVLWMAFWRSHYAEDRIEPWGSCADEEFLEFFAEHRRKIVALRRRERPAATRYASKNNVNIARIPALLDAIPDATVLVPVRDPIQHAHSLHRQHARFSELHEGDRFARRYMAAIGHFDFGADLKVIDFDEWYARRSESGPDRIGFWLEYWLASYRYLVSHARHERLHFVPFESMGSVEVLESLAAALGLDDSSELLAEQGRLSPPADRDVDTGGVAAPLLNEVRGLHRALLA